MNALALTHPPVNYFHEALPLRFPRSIPPVDRFMVFMNIYGYFDESGTHKGSTSFALAGFLGRADEWGVFDYRWRAALADFKLPFFHMADFESRLEGYDWPQKVRQDRLNRLLSIIDDHIVGSFGVVIPFDQYDEIFPKDEIPPEREPEWIVPGILGPRASRPGDPPVPKEPDMRPGAIRRRSGGPYGLAATMLFHEVGTQVLALSGDPYVAYTMEIGAEGRGQTLALFNDNYENEGQRHNLRLLSLHFEDKQRVPQLQAADLLAYELYKHLPRQRGIETRPTRYTLRILGRMPRSWIAVDADELRKWHDIIALGLGHAGGTWNR